MVLLARTTAGWGEGAHFLLAHALALRETGTTTAMTTERLTSHAANAWVLESLAAKSHDKCKIEVGNVALLQGASIALWLFSGKDGRVMRKSRHHSTCAALHDAFERSAMDTGTAAANYVASAKFLDGSCSLLAADDWRKCFQWNDTRSIAQVRVRHAADTALQLEAHHCVTP